MQRRRLYSKWIRDETREERRDITIWCCDAESTGQNSQHKLFSKGGIYTNIDDWYCAATVVSRFHCERVGARKIGNGVNKPKQCTCQTKLWKRHASQPLPCHSIQIAEQPPIVPLNGLNSSVYSPSTLSSLDGPLFIFIPLFCRPICCHERKPIFFPATNR